MLFKKFFLICFLLLHISLAQEQVGVYEKQGEILPLNLEFINEYNEKKSIKQLLRNKATIISFNYFNCPSLCSPQLHSLASLLDKLELKPYMDYQVLTFSIDNNDKPKKALEKKDELLKNIKKPFPPQAWNFLTFKDEKTIKELSDKVGFKYKKRIKDGVVDYLHAGLLIVISPKGKITRYINGIDYLPFDLKLALLEASDEKTRPTITKALLYCFAYDAKSKTYIFQAEKVIGTLILLIIFIFFLYLLKGGKKDGK